MLANNKSTLQKIAGGYLLIEGLGSMIYSSDKRELSQLGRIVRIGIGIYLVKSARE